MTGRATLAVDRIDVPAHRLHRADAEWVEAVAASIRLVGLREPIEVHVEGSRYVLVHGEVRLRALGLLGIAEAPAVIHPPLTAEQRLEIEAHQNLLRAQLTALERAESLALLKSIYERRHPETGRGKYRRGGGGINEIISFSSDTASKTGLSRRAIELAVALWQGLSVVSRDRLRGTHLEDHQAQLIVLSRLSEEEQSRVLDLVLSTPPAADTVADALVLLRDGRLPTDTERRYRTVSDGLARLRPQQRAGLFDLYQDEIVRHARKRGWV